MPVLKEPMRRKLGNKKLLIILLLLFITLLAVLFFNSSISKISDIQIEGNRFATREQIEEAFVAKVGDAFFGTSSGTLEERVATLPQVEKASVTKAFPGVVKIKVQEYPVVAFELAADGEMTALLRSGATVDASTDRLMLIDKPVLTGWKAGDPYKAELTKQLGAMSAKRLSDLSEITPYPSAAYPDRIMIYTRSKFEVITAVSVLPEKIDALNAVIESQEPGKVTMLLADTYEPFQIPNEEAGETEQNGTTQ